MNNTTQEFVVAASACGTLRNAKGSQLIYLGDLLSTLNYAATYFNRDTGDAHEGYWRANKYSNVIVYDENNETLAVFSPRKVAS